MTGSSYIRPTVDLSGGSGRTRLSLGKAVEMCCRSPDEKYMTCVLPHRLPVQINDLNLLWMFFLEVVTNLWSSTTVMGGGAFSVCTQS